MNKLLESQYVGEFHYNSQYQVIQDDRGDAIIYCNCSSELVRNIVHLLNQDGLGCKFKNLKILCHELYINEQYIGDFCIRCIRNSDEAKIYWSTIIKLLSDD